MLGLFLFIHGMKKTILLFIYTAIFTACKKEAAKTSSNYLAGTWTEQVPDSIAYYEATQHSFTFLQDSFFAKIISWTDNVIILPGDPCPNPGYMETYIRGKYLLANDSIFFNGKLCDSTYRHDQASCQGVLNYDEAFYFSQTGNAIILNPDKPSSFGMGIILRKQ